MKTATQVLGQKRVKDIEAVSREWNGPVSLDRSVKELAEEHPGVSWEDDRLVLITDEITIPYEGQAFNIGAMKIGIRVSPDFNRHRDLSIERADGVPKEQVHPHVKDNACMKRETFLPLRRAMEQMRLGDAFSIVIGFLNSHDPEDDWYKGGGWLPDSYSCGACGGPMPSGVCRYCGNAGKSTG